MYIDDFVITTVAREKGAGRALFVWLETHARKQNCAAVQLDSGLHRETVQRFYRSMSMELTCNHFTKMLP
jgi:predicted GNAT superfamily acetyltransferase